MTMKTYNICCPHCGTINRDLYLEETGGSMECERCHLVTRIPALSNGESNARWWQKALPGQSDKPVRGGLDYAGTRHVEAVLVALSKLWGAFRWIQKCQRHHQGGVLQVPRRNGEDNHGTPA